MEWISVEDRLPALNRPVLAHNTAALKHPVIPAMLVMRGVNPPNFYVWSAPNNSTPLSRVTHWMPLPPPPATSGQKLR